MTTGLALLILNILACSLAGIIYSLWAWKWFRRGNWLLAILNAFVAVPAFGFAFSFALIVMNHEVDTAVSLRPLVPLLVLFPAIARWFELTREEHHEAFAAAVKTALLGRGRG